MQIHYIPLTYQSRSIKMHFIFNMRRKASEKKRKISINNNNLWSSVAWVLHIASHTSAGRQATTTNEQDYGAKIGTMNDKILDRIENDPRKGNSSGV